MKIVVWSRNCPDLSNAFFSGRLRLFCGTVSLGKLEV
jgi:hypothetical protein